MKSLTTEQQQEAIRIIKGLANHLNNKLNEHIDLTDSAKRFVNSLKPKYYIAINQCGNLKFVSHGITVEDKQDALSFDTIDEACEYIESRDNSVYEYLILIK
jgi:hypothetical protein